MGKMMWEALRHHDRERFEVFGYRTNDARDEWTERYESIFAGLRALGALTDRDAAQRIAADDLDVLVDLSTHTKGARPAILATEAGARADHPRRERGNAGDVGDRFQADRPLRRPRAGYDPTLQIEGRW